MSIKTPLEKTNDRLKALYETGLLDSDQEARFDRITRLVASTLATPVVLVSLVDEKQQFFKSAIGLGEPWNTARETPLSHSFCQYVVEQDAPLIINDAPAHPLVCDNLAIPDLGVQAYLGIPIRTEAGEVLGSLCAIDVIPRVWTAREQEILTDFAKLVEEQILLREYVSRVTLLDEQRELVKGELSHRIKNVFAVISSLLNISARTETDLACYVKSVTSRIHALSHANDYIVDSPHQSGGHKPRLFDLLHKLVLPFNQTGQQVFISGDDIDVGERSATAIALIIHELATNASKYGALSVEQGTVHIETIIADKSISLNWREQGGPAITDEPNKKGFGSKMVSRTIQSQLHGSIDYDWAEGGLTSHIKLPTEAIGH